MKSSTKNEPTKNFIDNNRINSNSSSIVVKESNLEYSILQFIEIILSDKNKTNTFDFITKVENYYIIGGTNEQIYFYDSFYQYINKFSLYNWINNIIYYKSKNTKKGNLFIVLCTKKGLCLFSINSLKDIQPIRMIKSPNSNFIIKFNDNNFVCCQENQLTMHSYFGSKILENTNLDIANFNICTKSGIKYNKIIILKSNKIISKGQDKLFFLDLNSKLINDIDMIEYSFIYFSNGLTLMPKNNNIILCACKKYLKSQRNG